MPLTPHMKYTDEVVKRFARLFRCREVTYGKYWPATDTEPKRGKTEHGPVPDALWHTHLDGQLPFLGSCPIMQDNVCYWGAIDLDDDASDHVALEARVRELHLPLVVCRSKSGGTHFFAFFSEPVAAKLVIEKLTDWAARLGIVNTAGANGKVRPVEIFPKQASVKPSQDGNWVNLPYWDAAATVRYALRDGNRLSLDEFLDYAESMRISESSLTAMRGATAAPTGGKRKALPVIDNGAPLAPFDPTNPFIDGPPCLESLHADGWSEGSRNESLWKIAIFLRLRNADGWQEDLQAFNTAHVTPPLDDGEMSILIGSIAAHPSYEYKCRDPMLVPVCNKAVCETRAFGVEAFVQLRIERDFPQLSELIKIDTDPPLWRLMVDDTQVEVPTEDLMYLAKFRKIVLEKKSLIIPMITQVSWDVRLRKLLSEAVTQEAPEDAGVRGEFMALVGAFLALRKHSRNWDAILLGKPFQEGEEVYFRAQDIMAFLNRKNFRHYSTNRVYSILKDHGGTSKKKRIGGSSVGVWAVPAPHDASSDLAMPTSGRPKF